MAATADVSLTTTPELVASEGEDFTAWFPVAVRYAVVAAETLPTVKGTKVPRGADGYALTREVAREGYVYVWVEPPNNATTGSVTK
jgi:hypothetical protein